MPISAIKRITSALRTQPRYLIRLDDACDTLDIRKWNAIESILDEYNIKPIVAVIPKNEDISLHYSKKNEDFWRVVKNWQSKGWHIAIHGYKHVYHHIERERLIFPFYDRSEFAGLDLHTQCELMQKARAEFEKNDIYPALWVAPSHCFDDVTLEAIRRTTDIRVISDGIALSPYTDYGFSFIPQQLWWPKRKFFGTWTICLHPDTMSPTEIDAFESLISNQFFRDFITCC